MKVLCIALLAFSVSQGQRPDAVKDGPEKRSLTALILREVEAPPAQVIQTIRRGLSDSDAAIRRLALDTVSARATSNPNTPVVSEAELSVLVNMADELGGYLQDPHARVRQAAVMAVGNLDLALAKARRLRPKTVRMFVAHYYREPDANVRAEIVKGLGLVQNTEGEIGVLIEKALDDSAQQVRFYAVRGAGRLMLPRTFEALMRSIEDPNLGVRIGALMAVSRYGDLARARIGQLQVLAQRETDPDARRTFQNVIGMLSKGAPR